MNPSNTPEQVEFFRALGSGDLARLQALVTDNPALLESFDYRNFGATPLTAVCFQLRHDLAKALLDLGADPNRTSDWSMGPWSPLHCAIYRGDKDLAELLLSRGAKMDVHTAAGLGNSAEIRRLLDADPERVTQRGGDGCHPLHFADTIEVAQLLLERGADIDGRCVDHYSTPAQYLCTCRPEVTRYLFSQGATADIFSATMAGDVAMIQQLLNIDPSCIQARINQTFFPPSSEHDVHNILTFTLGGDSTPMHAAAKSNHRRIVQLLIDCGLAPDVRGGYDQGTPLHVAAWNNCVESAKALLEGGADIEARSGQIHNNSPAGWAIVSGADGVFQLLMETGAARLPWFMDDARDACAGRFDQVSRATHEQRHRILAWLES